MFGIGETELVIIVVFAFLLFGPDKLPGMGRTLGRMLRQFREASDGFTEVVQTSIMDPAAEELERSDKSPKQRRREAELEAAAQARDAAGQEGDAGDGEAVAAEPLRRETFAERKARLLAERKAKEAAEAEAAQASAAEAVAEEVEGGTTEPAVPAAPADEASAPAARTASDLYAMGGRHSSRFHADDAVEGGTDEPAGKGEAPEGVSEDEIVSKEEGGER